MAVTELSYPVTGSVGTYKNIFASNKPLPFTLERKDILISTITSGTDGRVRIQAGSNFNGISIGDQITWQSDGYTNRSSKVTAVINATTIEINETFINTNASNGWINYLKNWYLEIRYVTPNTSTDEQNALLILDDFSQVPSDPRGIVLANINAPADLIEPDFNITTEEAKNLYKQYKIQYRQSYEGNRNDTWESPANDLPILLVHASVDFTANDFTDAEITKRYVRGYPLMYSFVYSSINDEGNNQLKITMTELGINGEAITSSDVVSFLNLNGVAIIAVDTNTLDADTAFVQFRSTLSTDNSQYDPAQYDPAQYA